ncbi:MAG: hypothetical protein WC666_00615 [Candidatus Paceibacterota bacterium]|jgi:hypothetical protein
MKLRLISIISSAESDEMKAKRIIALAVVKDDSTREYTDGKAEELTALRSVFETIKDCSVSEAPIPPKLFWLLCLELERRARAFAMAETRESFVQERD